MIIQIGLIFFGEAKASKLKIQLLIVFKYNMQIFKVINIIEIKVTPK